MKHLVRILVAVAILAGLYALAGWAFGFDRLARDFWPLDQGVAANILASFVGWVIVAVVVYFAWRPLKDAVDRWWKARTADLHRKLDRNFAANQHIAKHSPGIPDIGPDGHTHPDWTPPAPARTEPSLPPRRDHP